MKTKLLTLAIALALFSACKNESSTSDSTTATDNLQEAIKQVDTTQAQELVEPETAGNVAVMTFASNEHDFGTINQGDKVSHTFTFKNTGTTDLIISDAQGTCGCTVPEFPKDPVKPGASGTMKVTFDSTGKSGNQQKSVNITANTQTGKEQLTIRANIKPKA